MFEVRIEGLRFRGFHGVFESERASGNEFVARVLAEVEGRADATDQLSDTVDYSALADLMLEVSASRSFMTVEGLAGAFADAAMERFPMVVALDVRIQKLAPKMAAEVESCGVRLRRERRIMGGR
ncbi:MAG: dihydroneopterin aldolase [Fimbriimonadaceae bacterium]